MLLPLWEYSTLPVILRSWRPTFPALSSSKTHQAVDFCLFTFSYKASTRWGQNYLAWPIFLQLTDHGGQAKIGSTTNLASMLYPSDLFSRYGGIYPNDYWQYLPHPWPNTSSMLLVYWRPNSPEPCFMHFCSTILFLQFVLTLNSPVLTTVPADLPNLSSSATQYAWLHNYLENIVPFHTIV